MFLKVCRAYASSRQGQDALYQEIHFQVWRALPDRKDQTFLRTWLSDDQHIQSIKTKMRQFERTIRRRDRIEIVAAVFAMLCFGLYFLLFHFVLARVGCVVVILSCALIYWKLVQAKRSAIEPVLTAPVVESVRQELEKVEAQARSLNSVFWWHVAPLMTGLNLFWFGLPRPDHYKIYFLPGTVLLSAVVYWLNQRALRRKISPLKKELEPWADSL